MIIDILILIILFGLFLLIAKLSDTYNFKSFVYIGLYLIIIGIIVLFDFGLKAIDLLTNFK